MSSELYYHGKDIPCLRKGVIYIINCNYLCDIVPGEAAIVRRLEATGGMRRRLLDLGMTPESRVECVGRSPGGGLSAYLVRGAVIAIRADDGRGVIVRRCCGGAE